MPASQPQFAVTNGVQRFAEGSAEEICSLVGTVAEDDLLALDVSEGVPIPLRGRRRTADEWIERVS